MNKLSSPAKFYSPLTGYCAREQAIPPYDLTRNGSVVSEYGTSEQDIAELQPDARLHVYHLIEADKTLCPRCYHLTFPRRQTAFVAPQKFCHHRSAEARRNPIVQHPVDNHDRIQFVVGPDCLGELLNRPLLFPLSQCLTEEITDSLAKAAKFICASNGGSSAGAGLAALV